MAKKRRSKDQLSEIDALVERLREFIRLNYMTAAEVARQIGVRDTTIYDWLLGQARPGKLSASPLS
jgi:transcriptional regulator with XRE-family HTH domain